MAVSNSSEGIRGARWGEVEVELQHLGSIPAAMATPYYTHGTSIEVAII